MGVSLRLRAMASNFSMLSGMFHRFLFFYGAKRRYLWCYTKTWSLNVLSWLPQLVITLSLPPFFCEVATTSSSSLYDLLPPYISCPINLKAAFDMSIIPLFIFYVISYVLFLLNFNLFQNRGQLNDFFHKLIPCC